MGLRGLAYVLVLAPVAALAQTAAAPPAGQPAAVAAPPPRHGSAGFGQRFGGGTVYAPGVPDGWMLRFDQEAFIHIAPRNTTGGLFGFMMGAEYWRAGDDNWGFDAPFAFVIGARAVFVRGLAGVGFNTIVVDQVADDTGFGLFAPMAMASLGLDIYGFTLLADTRVSRRFQIGAPDHTQLMVSLMFGVTLDAKSTPRAFQ